MNTKTKKTYGKNYFGNLPSKQKALNKKTYAKRYNGGDCPQSELGSKTMKRKWLRYSVKSLATECPCCKMKSSYQPEYRTKSWSAGCGMTWRVTLMVCQKCCYSNYATGGSIRLW